MCVFHQPISLNHNSAWIHSSEQQSGPIVDDDKIPSELEKEKKNADGYFMTYLPDPRCCPSLKAAPLGSRGRTGRRRPWVWRRSQSASVVLPPSPNACHHQRGPTKVHLWLEMNPTVKTESHMHVTPKTKQTNPPSKSGASTMFYLYNIADLTEWQTNCISVVLVYFYTMSQI